MKMVSASKLRGDQQRLVPAIVFNDWVSRIYPEAQPIDSWVVPADLPQNNLILALTSDRGLCGGINSTISRSVRSLVGSMTQAGKEVHIVVVGEKGRSQIRRQFRDKMESTITDLHLPLNFETSTLVTQEVLLNQFDAVHVVYNHFKSAISYVPSIRTFYPLKFTGVESPLPEYSFEPDTKQEILNDLFELTLGSQIFHSMMQSATSEQSSRMNAMETASKNAGEMIEKLTLKYNRARQARITTELIEIISGASALD